MLKNNFQHWRLQLAAKINEDISKKRFAQMLSIEYTQYFKYESCPERIPSGQTLYAVWQVLLVHFPNLHIEDLFGDDDETG